jgi:hypothetical protein
MLLLNLKKMNYIKMEIKIILQLGVLKDSQTILLNMLI